MSAFHPKLPSVFDPLPTSELNFPGKPRDRFAGYLPFASP
jgi:hypothetical protein